MNILVKHSTIISIVHYSFHLDYYLYECHEMNEQLEKEYNYPELNKLYNKKEYAPYYDPCKSVIYQKISIDIDPRDTHFNKLKFLEKLAKAINAREKSWSSYDGNAITIDSSELTEIAKKTYLNQRAESAFINGTMNGLFQKLQLPRELGAEVGKYLSLKDASQVASTCKLSAETGSAELRSAKIKFS